MHRRAVVLPFLFLGLVLAAAMVAGCRPAHHERPNVAVSVFPLYDLVRRIAGPDADVTLVLPPGASPEGWVPPPDAAARVAGAKMLVSVGLGVDPWMDALLPRASPKARILKLGDRVPTIASGDGATGTGLGQNGYVWMDPQRARLMATAIAEDLARTDPSNALAYRERASALDASLAALDREIEARTASGHARDVVTLPPSMAYYAERYGFHERKPGAVAAGDSASEARFDALGGSATGATYEDLIRFDTAALERDAK